jgi:hypothetical protein
VSVEAVVGDADGAASDGSVSSDGSGSLVGDAGGEEVSAVGVGARTVGRDSAVLQATGSANRAAAVIAAAARRYLPPGDRMPGTIAA